MGDKVAFLRIYNENKANKQQKRSRKSLQQVYSDIHFSHCSEAYSRASEFGRSLMGYFIANLHPSVDYP